MSLINRKNAFVDENNPISDMDPFVEAVEKALSQMEPAHRAAVIAVCLEGKELTEDLQDDYAHGLG